jgi:hypothetical protein
MRKFLILFTGIVLSQNLVQEIMQQLGKQPYSEVAPMIAKILDEAAHQPGPAAESTPTQVPERLPRNGGK